MSDAEIEKDQPVMGFGKAVGVFGAAIVALFVVLAIAGKAEGAAAGFLGIGGYLLLGVALNRVVLRGLIEWHPVYNTLDNVASAKLGMVLLWPIRYPVLFFKLLVTKHL